MKKRFLTLIPILALILVCIPMAFQANAAGRNSIDITVSVPDSVKIGQSWNGVVPEITVEGTAGRCSLEVGTNENDVTFSASGFGQNGRVDYVTQTNSSYISVCLYPVVTVSEDDKYGGIVNLPEPNQVAFTVNGETISSDRIVKEEGENGQYYRIEAYPSITISGRTTYPITTDGTAYQGGYYLDLSGMPSEAEAGASIVFSANLATDTYLIDEPYSVEYYTLNGTQIANGETFVMPEKEALVGAKVIDKYEGWRYVPEVNVTIDFKDEDIFYGRKLPTEEDFLNALSVSCSTPGVNIRVKRTEIATIVDGDFDALPWVGNQFLSFWIEVDEGYLLANPYLTDYYMDGEGNESNPQDDWLRENLTVTVNGQKRNFALSMYPSENKGVVYADGYMVSDYYVSAKSIEIHVHWYGWKDLVDFDLSGYSAGDTVTIPDSAFDYDGYIPTGYWLFYYSDEYGQCSDYVRGKTFVVPDADGDIVIKADYLRGDDGSQYTEQSKDSDGHISLDIDEGTFKDTTVLQINKVDEDDYYGEGAEILELVDRTLINIANDSVTFEITALSFNEEVQPQKKIIVTFPIPEGFDSDYIAFYHVGKDGTYEVIPAEIDREKGVCRAVIEHFSTYAIVSLNEESNLPTHIIHELTLVPEEAADCTENGHCAYYACSGCDKWFADENGTIEITDKNSVSAGYESDGHTGGTATCSQKAVCTECEQEYGEYNAENHVDTKVINAKTENCGENGYTGDTYCNDCQKTVATGTTVNATGNHSYNNGVCSGCGGVDPNYTPDSPATGDNSMIHLWIALLALSALGIVAVSVKRKAYK